MAVTWKKVAYELDVITKAFMAAKGDLISASADDTPLILTVGADGLFLKALASEATGLIWAAPSIADINDITNVVITEVADNEVLTYDNGTSKWINETLAQADIATATDLTTHEAVKAANATLGHVIVETASKIDVDGDGKLTLGAHAADHKDGATDELLLHELGEPTGAVPFDYQQAANLVVNTVANEAGLPSTVGESAVGMLCFATTETSLHVCTASAE